MKIISNIYMAAKRLAAAVATLSAAALLLTSCVVDTGGSEKPDGGDQALVVLSVSTPGPARPSTKAQVDPETDISEVRVLVFGERSGEYVFDYHTKGTEVSGSGAQTRFRAMIKSTSEPVKLILLINAGEAFEANAPSPGDTEAEVKRALSVAFTSAGLNGDLPMYGEALLDGGIDASDTYSLEVTALRAIARVDVELDLADSGTFTLEEVYAFRANDGIRFIPDALAPGGDMKVTAPSIPSGSSPLADPVMRTAGEGADSVTRLYLPESIAAVTDGQKIREATTIVVGGRFGGGDNPVTYYRADFNPGVEGHPFGQVLRNHRYIFRIKSVSAEGWPTPEEAARNMSTSITVEVQPWEDFSTEMWLGNDRFGISARRISLRYTRNRERGLDVESTFAYAIQWLENGSPAGESTAGYGQVIANPHFEAWIEQGADEHITRLMFRTLNDNHLGEIVTDTLRITAGPWVIDLPVSQDNSAIYSDRFMKILSTDGIGDLGENLVASGASGMAMRRVLDVQFAPTGVIRIGGSSFTHIPNTAGYLGTSTAENLEVLTRIFGAQDVVYLSYGALMSSASADLILAWLDASPHRVLILGTDSDGSSKPLREKGRITADGTWTYTGINTVSSEYVRAAYTDGADEFFDGPFGQVTAGAAFNRVDDIAGYNKAYPDTVTPLITADRAGYAGYMFFGVNKQARIVYHGDAQLFMTSQMSNNIGNVTTDLDRLMANTWAWIIEQVIYGDE